MKRNLVIKSMILSAILSVVVVAMGFPKSITDLIPVDIAITVVGSPEIKATEQENKTGYIERHLQSNNENNGYQFTDVIKMPVFWFGLVVTLVIHFAFFWPFFLIFGIWLTKESIDNKAI